LGPAAIVFVFGLGAASSPAVDVQWTAPAECPSDPDVEARVRDLVGPETGLAGGATANVVASGDRFAASITLRSDRGTTTRSFAADSCDALADAVALVIAVGLDPLAVSTIVRDVAPTIAPPPAIDPTTTTVTEPEPIPPRVVPRSRPAPRRRPAIGLRGFAHGTATLGIFPDVGGLAGGGLALTLDRARLELVGHHEVGRRFTHPSAPNSGALIGASAGRLAACWTPSAARFIFPLCAGAEIGAMTARGRGISDRGRVDALWAAAVPAVRALWFPIRAFGFGLVLEMPIALTRPRFVIDDVAGQIVDFRRIGARVGLVLEVVFFDENRRTRR
jgi:hypothetical protein